MIAQCFSRREKASAFVAREFADFSVLGNFVAETIVLSRKLLCTAKGTRERGARFRFVCFHVYFESVLASEASFTSNDQAWEAPPMITLGAQGR